LNGLKGSLLLPQAVPLKPVQYAGGKTYVIGAMQHSIFFPVLVWASLLLKLTGQDGNVNGKPRDFRLMLSPLGRNWTRWALITAFYKISLS